MTNNEYLPYKTINVFIERDHLQKILESILQNIKTLPKDDQISFGNFFREHVEIFGFRNPMRAPLPLQINAFVRAFEDKDEVIPFTLSTWTKINENFSKIVKEWLNSKGWKELRFEKKFDETEGFTRDWPENLTFENLKEEFNKVQKDLEYEDNDLMLMIMWISGKLPDEDNSL